MDKSAERLRAISILAEEINKRRLTIFIGAGCSISAGLPSWKDLTDALLKEYHIKTKDTNLIRLASRLERDVGTLEFRGKVAESLRTRPDTITTLHDILVSLDVNLFITTNYDHLLEDSFRKHGYSPTIITDDKDLPSIDPSRKTIVKLHGDLDSPASLVVTLKDYTRFKSQHRVFVEWLNSVVSQNTVLFLGTSFEDPRLKEVDEHVLSLFGEFRRQPFIFLKVPKQDSITLEQDFEIELEDFEALCEDFRERDFFVILINRYDEIDAILQEIDRRVSSKKVQAHPSDTESVLQSDYSGTLEQNLRNLLDEKTLELSEHVRGKGRLPTPALMIERAEELIRHLENPPFSLSQESQVEGFLTAADALLNSDKREHISRARQYYEKANVVFQNIPDPGKWEERLMRVRAKLLFFEGETDEAIESIAHSEDGKTVSIWLALLIDSGRLKEAYDFVSTHEIDDSWVCEALYILICSGYVQQAEEMFQKKTEEYESLKNNRRLKKSLFGGTFFYEKMCFVMADAFYRRAIRLTGKPDLSHIFPGELTNEGEQLCRKALKFIDLLFGQVSIKNLAENYFTALAVRVEMSAAYLLKKWKRSDTATKNLISLKPINKEVVNYVVRHSDHFDTNFNEKVVQRLSEDHPEKSWAFLRIAILEGFVLNNKEASWKALQKAMDIAVSLDERVEVARMALDLGLSNDRLDEAFVMISDILPPGDLHRKFLEAHYHHQKGDMKSTEQLFTEIESQNPSPVIAAEISFLRAERAIKQERWEEARKLLEHSKNLVLNPLTLKELLYVLTKLQDDAEALRISEQIESIGIEDWQAIHIKAQTARNLGRFKKSEKAWRHLRRKFPEKPEYAYGLAEVLVLRDKSQDVLRILEPFIQCDEKTHHGCLALACSIYETNEEYEEAFDLLERCQKQIENDPALLLKHMELSYRTDREEEAHRSMLRLEVLRQEGKVPEEAFTKVSFDKVLEMFKKRKESLEKQNNLYRIGQIPRILLCEHKNMAMYLDWAVRTQKLKLSTEVTEWIDYTTYSTNGMRVELAKGRNQLVPITAPRDVNEIVIDYHALITVHRLDLLEILEKRYSKIYYPQILKILWASDRKRFGHHQLSKEKAYIALNDRLQTSQIREFVAPDPPNVNDLKNDTSSKRNLRLARLEDFPLIDAYVKEEGLTDFPEVSVFRLSQAIEWLYSKGRLSEKKFLELKAVSKGRPAVIKDHVNSKLDNASQLLIDETTLEIMEQYGLIQLLFDLGVQVIVERATGYNIRNAVLELNFGQKVGKWHWDLANFVKNAKNFREVFPEIDSKDRSLIHSPYDEAAFSSIKYAEDNRLFLLTDDRWSQMIRTQKLTNRQFGTDALLTDLYEKQIISLEEYSNHFLKLCKWRYRFMIPDVRILVFFAKEYKKNLPGEPLRSIADYGRKCMEDTGLFWGLESTDPPLPLGIKFHMTWTSSWIEFLVDIWKDDDFTNEDREKTTQKVYYQYLPHLPRHIKDEIRRNYASVDAKGIIMQLFNSTVNVEEPFKLYGLFKRTFDIFGFDEERSIAELRTHLEFLRESLRKYNKDILRLFVNQTLMAFYGEAIYEREIHPSILPILMEIGIVKENQKKVPKQISIDNKPKKYKIDDLPDLISSRKRIPEYSPKGPLIIVPPSEDKLGTVLIPHDFIQALSREVRIAAIKYILEHDNVSSFTKRLTEEKSTDIQSGTPAVWHPASSEVSYALLKDFHYARSLFVQIFFAPLPDKDKHRLLDKAWTNAMAPNLDTVLDKMPLILQDPFEKEEISKRVKAEVIAKGFEQKGKNHNPLQSIFDWYLENVYFVPVGPSLNPWQIVKHTFRISKTKRKEGKADEKITGRVTSLDILNAVTKWISSKEDPLAYLMALELVLNARAMASEEEETAFTGDDFYYLLDRLLEVVLNEEKKDVQEEETKMINAVWQMRIHLARYYLKYIDLNIKENLEDEKKIALAWWMARELEFSVVQSLNDLNIKDKILTIEQNTKRVIERQENLIGFAHLFEDHRQYVSPGRYCTLEVRFLLASAALSMLALGDKRDKDHISPLTGLKQPATALSIELRDEIINKLMICSMSGDGQIPIDIKSELSLLWNFPLCISAPDFLKNYYENAFDFIGEGKVGVIKLAESVSQSNFLDTELINILQYIKEKQGLLLSVTLASLKAFVFTRGKMPEGAAVFEENEQLGRAISEMEDNWAATCLFTLAKIVGRLQSAGDFNWSKIISKLFETIDYSLCSKQTIELIVPELIGVVLLGCDYSLLSPIFKRKASDKRVRRALGHVKISLEYSFPRVPGAYRENIRRILNDLEDIPIPEEKESLEGY